MITRWFSTARKARREFSAKNLSWDIQNNNRLEKNNQSVIITYMNEIEH
jgi:hypothetical protein